MIKNIVCWMPTLTDHMSFTYSEIAKNLGIRMLCYVTKDSHKMRREQGWVDTPVRCLRKERIPKVGFFIFSILKLIKNRKSIHFFGSPFEDKRLFFLICIAVRLKIKVYLISESYSTISQSYLSADRGLLLTAKSFLRPYIYKMYIYLIGQNLQGIFAISELACEQYVSAGLNPDKIFPFGYFVPSLNDLKKNKQKDVKNLKLVYVGSLIPIKGLDILIDAVYKARLNGCNVSLDVYGPGDEKKYKFENKYINYKGVIPFGQTQKFIINYDILVLPSNYDGWGVVVNEAILVGLAVICSDKVGSSTLVTSTGVGNTFPRGNIKYLSEIIQKYESKRYLLKKTNVACRKTSKIIQPNYAASHMINVINAQLDNTMLPLAPWYSLKN
ncbi:glycosyltransferase [Amylibacter sp.]|nr:glycosyltransferase [Amylibacter sp.]